MQLKSLAPLVEEQLDLTLRLLLGLSASMTVEELGSIRQRLVHMHLTVGHVVALKTLESDGVVPLGNCVLCLLFLNYRHSPTSGR